MADPRDTLGRRGEAAAERFLKRLGLRVLERRYQTPFGEIDLICRAGETVVFVEVKTRRSDEHAAPHEQHRAAQQRRLIKAARWYRHQRRLDDRPARFDVVGVTWPAAAAEPHIEHFPEAFLPNR